MSKPTPRPWKRYDNTVGPGADDSWRITAFTKHDIAKVRTETNAAHIVKCVNLHDELIECLKLASYEVWEMSNGLAKGGPAKSEVEKLSARISAVLAKAEGRDE